MISAGSIAKTRLAPSWHDRTAMIPGPVPISTTTAPGRTDPRRAWAYASMRTRSASISPEPPRLYISVGYRYGTRGLADRKPPCVGSDSFTEGENFGWIGGSPHAAHGHSGQHTSQDIKIARAHVTVEEIVHVGTGDQGSQRPVAREILHYRSCQILLALAENVHRAQGQRLRLEPAAVSIERQVSFVTGRRDTRQGVLATHNGAEGIRPQIDPRIARLNQKAISLVNQNSHVIREHRKPAQCKGCGRGRFSRPGR